MSIDLGANPIDPYYAYRAAVESSLDITSGIMELAGNAKDYTGNSGNIFIKLNGNPIPNKPGFINLKSVVVSDDGCGMDHATVWEKFRGAYHDSASHSSVDKSGRNGVGVKTNLQYWKEIRVETTTKGFIPLKKEWSCKNDNRDEIDSTYRSLTSLKPGSRDIETRKYVITVDRTVCNEEWGTSDPDDSFTKVTLKEPRDPIEFDMNALIKRLSHMIDFLDKSKSII